MTTAKELLSTARLRESTLRLVTRGDLLADHDAAVAELERLTKPAVTLSDETAAAAERVRDLEALIEASTVTLRFRALSRTAYQALLTEHPGREGEEEVWNWQTFIPALISACLIDPAMTVDEVIELLDLITEGQRDELFSAAYDVNQAVTRVPFSERASVVTRWRERNSSQPEPGASPAASS